jgi:hypothetical protein
MRAQCEQTFNHLENWRATATIPPAANGRDVASTSRLAAIPVNWWVPVQAPVGSMTMSGSANRVIFATICNTVGEASAYSLWFTDGTRQFVADLSGHLDDAGGLTGIAMHNDRIYLAVQSPVSRILVLDQTLRVVDTIRHEGFNDLHSLHVVGDFLMIVSARSGLVFRRDLRTGEMAEQARFAPHAWVCDALCTAEDIWLCGHDLSYLDPAAKGGGIFSIRQRRAIMDGLSGPHSIIPYRDGYVVLDSANAQVVFFVPGGARQTVQLQGFLRGAIAVGNDTLLVAGGPDRTMSRKNPEGDGARGLRQVLHERLRVFELKQNEPIRIFLPECPGFEIYELFLLPEGTVLRPAADTIIAAEPGLFARYFYTSLITAHVRASEAV